MIFSFLFCLSPLFFRPSLLPSLHTSLPPSLCTRSFSATLTSISPCAATPCVLRHRVQAVAWVYVVAFVFGVMMLNLLVGMLADVWAQYAVRRATQITMRKGRVRAGVRSRARTERMDVLTH
eukprot:5097127-Pleurochrysis_carterae.AAC.1